MLNSKGNQWQSSRKLRLTLLVIPCVALVLVFVAGSIGLNAWTHTCSGRNHSQVHEHGKKLNATAASPSAASISKTACPKGEQSIIGLSSRQSWPPDDTAKLPWQQKYIMHELHPHPVHNPQPGILAIDDCQGLDHQLRALSCALEEARALNRTFVLPYWFCVSGRHQPDGRTFQMLLADLLDLDSLAHHYPIITRENFTTMLTTAQQHGLTVSQPINNTVLPSSLLLRPEDILWRVNRIWDKDYWWEPCVQDAADPKSLNLAKLWGGLPWRPGLPLQPAPALRDVASIIRGRIGSGGYASLHVRRGDKLNNPSFPGLENDTAPANILGSIKRHVSPGQKLFVASDERDPAFFAPLTDHYKVYTWRNFTDVLMCAGIVHPAEANEMQQRQAAEAGCECDQGIDGREAVVGNVILLFAVEKILFQNAIVHLDTFRHLTKLPKRGYGAIAASKAKQKAKSREVPRL